MEQSLLPVFGFTAEPSLFDFSEVREESGLSLGGPSFTTRSLKCFIALFKAQHLKHLGKASKRKVNKRSQAKKIYPKPPLPSTFRFPFVDTKCPTLLHALGRITGNIAFPSCGRALALRIRNGRYEL